MRTEYSGLADDRDLALDEPRALVSYALYSPRGEEPKLTLERWEFPGDEAQHESAAEFEKLLRSRKAFVLGGTQFVVEMGLVADWYRDDETRQEATDLLQSRGLGPLLHSLRDKENGADAIFGKKALSEYIGTLPKLKRDGADAKGSKRLSNRELYTEHLLRLRKVIEFITLTEVVVRRRLRAGKSQKRFEAFTGLSGKDENNALYVWDHMWIEPVIFVVDPLPRKRDIRKMIGTERIARAFEQATSHPRGALAWPLLGVPCKRATAQAAAAACNSHYGPDAEQTDVVTARPAEFRESLQRLRKERDFTEYVKDIERIWSLGPPKNDER
jgi:hypothetical protein